MRIKLLGVLCMVSTLCMAAAPITFEKTFGGKEDDVAKSVVKTADGYLIAGKTKSFTSDRDFDAYLIKIDKKGDKIWSKIYGGEDDEEANDLIQYGKDFVFIGSTETYGNERLSFYITRIHGDGDIDWQVTYYRDEDDEYFGNGIATDGIDLVAAGTERHLNFMSSKINPLIFQLNQEGTRGWRGYYGGKDDDFAHAIIYTGDGYLMAGKTETYGHGDLDAYLVKLDKNGKEQWYAAYGGKDDDIAYDVIATEDGYMLVGSTDSFDLTSDDVYVVKLDKNGKMIWQKSFGGNRDDEGYAITQSPDGGYVIVGRTESFSRRNGFDLYLFKIDGSGKLIWERTYGSESDDAGYDIVSTEDGYLIVGEKKTKISRDSDVWILKVDLKGKR